MPWSPESKLRFWWREKYTIAVIQAEDNLQEVLSRHLTPFLAKSKSGKALVRWRSIRWRRSTRTRKLPCSKTSKSSSANWSQVIMSSKSTAWVLSRRERSLSKKATFKSQRCSSLSLKWTMNGRSKARCLTRPTPKCRSWNLIFAKFKMRTSSCKRRWTTWRIWKVICRS